MMAEARKYTDEFPPVLRTLLGATDLSTVSILNARDKEPIRHTDPAYSDIVFIGDANHAVTPFAGNGANMALCDGWDFASFLCTSGSLSVAIAAYDAVAEPRSKQVLKQSHFSLDLAHAKGRKAGFYLIMLRVISFLFSGRNATKSNKRQ
jgi:2-polyprenyl-6-methoxyphenol hydroxylase-like FAD-dependent oxidoreductase